RSDGRTVMFAPTAPGQPVSDALDPDKARERVGGITPEPYAPDRAAVAATLEKELGEKTGFSVVWLSDGLDYGDGEAFAGALAKFASGGGSLSVLRPERDDAALALGQGVAESGAFAARILSGSEGPRAGVVKALTGRGEPLGEAPFTLGQ